MPVVSNPQRIKAAELKYYLLENNISNNYIEELEPFEIIFDNFIFKVERVLRILPNRRLVFSGTINDSDKVVLKTFIDSAKYQKDYIQNEQGYNLLQRLELDTPKIITAFCDKVHQQSYFLSKYIESEASAMSTNLLIAAIAKLHKNNICQNDLHVNNFILNNNIVYYLDYAGLTQVKPFNGNIKNCAQFDNFALFLAQLNIKEHIQWSHHIKHYLNCYLPEAHIPAKAIEKYILSKAKQSLKTRLHNFSNKCLRNCTDFKLIINHDLGVKSNVNGLVRRDAIEEYNLLDFINKFLQNNVEDKNKILDRYSIKTLKNGNTARVLLLEYNNKKFIVKHYLAGNKCQQLLRTIKYLFIKPRAMRSWLNANFLEHLGIATAKPMAFLLQGSGFFNKDSFFIMEYIEDLQRLDGILESNELKVTEKYSYISTIKNLLKDFAFLNIVHRDFKSVNIGFKNNKLFLLDLDAMQQYNTSFFFKKVKNKDSLRITECLKSYPGLLEFYQGKQ